MDADFAAVIGRAMILVNDGSLCILVDANIVVVQQLGYF
jgi:hypothetical protein